MNLRDAWIDAALVEHARTVDATTLEGEERITGYFEAIGWRWAITRAGGERYTEELRRANSGLLEYCGIFWAAMGLDVGMYVRPPLSPDLQVNPRVAEYVLPSTYRVEHSGHWGKVPRAERVTIHEMARGDIITVVTGQNKAYGDHFAGVVDVDLDRQIVQTVEANASGVLGSGEHGRGVVRRERKFEAIRRIYRFDERHFLRADDE